MSKDPSGSQPVPLPSGISSFLCSVLILAIVSVGSRLEGQVAEEVEYVDDIDRWQVEVYSGAANPGGLLQGPAPEAGHDRRGSLCFLSSGEAFTAGEGVVFSYSRAGAVRYFAGLPGRPGYRDGPAAGARLGRQLDLCADNRGGLYVADRSNRCLRRLHRESGIWVIETIAGDPARPAAPELLRRVRDEGPMEPGPRDQDILVDGIRGGVGFHYLHSNVIADKGGNAYLMDADFLRRVRPDGRVETLNPRGGSGPPADPDGEPLESARFRLIMGGGICFGGDGKIYVADRWNHCVRQVDLEGGLVRVVIGPGRGYVDGPAAKAGFHGGTTCIIYDPYRERFYTNGADDWGLRVWDGHSMKTIAGGRRANTAATGPAREAGIHWTGVRAIDPRPPHDIYFWSGHANWRGRIGRLYVEGEK